MRILLRRVLSVVLNSSSLPILVKWYLDIVKMMYQRPIPQAGRLGRAIFVSFPYNSLGDVLALIPLLERIHEEWPAVQLHVALGDLVAPFLNSIPFIHVVPVNVAPHRGAIIWRLREMKQLVLCFRRLLRKEYYELVISPRWGSDAYSRASRYLAYLAPSDRRISYSASVDGGPKTLDWLSTQLAMGGESEPESVRQIKLLERVALVEPDKDIEAAIRSETKALVGIAAGVSRAQIRELLKSLTGLQVDGYIVVSPGASRASNRWPIDRFGEVLLRLYRMYQFPVFAVGANADAVSCEALSKKLPEIVFSLGGKTTLWELAAIIRGAQLFVGNDSGPGHMAGGLGVRCIVLTAFAERSNQTHKHSAVRWRPNGPFVSQIGPLEPVAPCVAGCDMERPHCILQITPGEVFDVASRQLGSVMAT